MRRIACAIWMTTIVILACGAGEVYAAGAQEPAAAARSLNALALHDFKARPVTLGTGYWRDGGSVRVRAVQRRLRALGYRPGPIDGLFGPLTDRATRRFQRHAHLAADGIVGPRTFRALRRDGARGGRMPRHAGPEHAPRPAGEPAPRTVRREPIRPESRPRVAPEPSPAPGRAVPVWWIVVGAVLAAAMALGVVAVRGVRLRALPLESRGKSLLAGGLSLAALGLVALYLFAPRIQGSCAEDCEPSRWLQLSYDVAACSVLAITLYFFCLCLVGLRVMGRPPAAPARRPPFFVLVVPARNEELVIAVTVRRLLELPWPRVLAVIVNDGSDDDTSAVARAAARGDRRLLVVDRPPEIAGQGKGAVLNHAYRVVRDMVACADPRLGGARAEDVVLCVVDADGWLQPNALEAVAPCYDDPSVAGVQVPVRMYNARAGFLAFMQDIEFIGYSMLVQGGRDPVGSVGLGGNGQFIRLSALDTLGPEPWTRSLVEDLDIGLMLVKRGWRNRMCPHTHVAQQAVTKPRRLLRQRTRWIQGHYTCWNHLPSLWRARSLPAVTRLDLSLHLFLAVTVLLGAVQTVLGLLGYLGVLPIHRSVLAGWMQADVLYRVSVVGLACGPLSLLSVAYQRSAVRFQGSPQLRLPLWALPGMMLIYTAYTYFWGLPCSVRAFARMALRRDSWAKTARDPITTAQSVAGAKAAAR